MAKEIETALQQIPVEKAVINMELKSSEEQTMIIKYKNYIISGQDKSGKIEMVTEALGQRLVKAGLAEIVEISAIPGRAPAGGGRGHVAALAAPAGGAADDSPRGPKKSKKRGKK
jgi:hypothetical protein